uniref:ABC-2 type transporter domain-containing protein n=1 Tax=Aegilops tauschii subsp. strangulata TaxID=200361 RepID=A0A453FZM6_AEGTS
MLTYLVYEKQQKLKIMMKMHGLKDGPYWMINYAYFFGLSAVYMILFVIFGSLIGLRLFTKNDYSIQFVFYLIHINVQIVLAFFASSFFSSVKIATVVGYIYVFGSGLLGGFLLHFFIEDTSFPSTFLSYLLPAYKIN